eukprot:486426-Amphidinium_carterae.1
MALNGIRPLAGLVRMAGGHKRRSHSVELATKHQEVCSEARQQAFEDRICSPKHWHAIPQAALVCEC